MTGFINQWKAFIEGVLTEKEALNFLQSLDTKKGQKALGNDLDRAWKEVAPDEFESEIAGIIRRFKEDRQKKTKAIKRSRTENKKAFLKAIKWAACIGAGLLLFFAKIDYSTFSDGGLPQEEPDKNEWVTKTNPKGIKSKIKLPDGSVVFLNASSTLTYERNFKVNRYIKLEGEAFFEVAKDSLQPFTVQAGLVETQALGTSFNVNAFNENTIQVALATGSVLVTETKTKGNIILKPGEYTKYMPQNKEMKKFPISPEKISLWKEGILHFEKMPFKELIPVLENWYGVNIEIRGAMPADNCTGEFEKNEYLTEVLTVLGHSIGFSFKIEGKEVLILN